jgi:hypothetical protein
MYGLAFVNSDDASRYEIVSLNQDLYFFSLTGQLKRGGSSLADVKKWTFDGTNWDWQPLDEFTVWDSGARFGPARFGECGVTQFNHSSGRWEIISLNRRGDYVIFKNDSGGAVSPGSLMEITGTDEVDGDVVFTIIKPSNQFQREYLVHAGSDWVDDGELGPATTAATPTEIKTQAGSTKAVYGSFGAKPGQWEAYPNRPGFTLFSAGLDGGDDALATQYQVNELIGKVYGGDLAAASSGQVKIYSGVRGSEVDAGWDALNVVYNRASASVHEGEWVRLDWINGNWYAEPIDAGRLVPFILNADLSQFGNAAAILEVWNGSGWPFTGAAVTVYDDSHGQGPAIAGDQGWAIRSQESGRYEVVSIERHINCEIHFTLLESKTTAVHHVAARAEVVFGDPLVKPGDVVRVHDPAYANFQGNFNTGGRATFCSDLELMSGTTRRYGFYIDVMPCVTSVSAPSAGGEPGNPGSQGGGPSIGPPDGSDPPTFPFPGVT